MAHRRLLRLVNAPAAGALTSSRLSPLLSCGSLGEPAQEGELAAEAIADAAALPPEGLSDGRSTDWMAWGDPPCGANITRTTGRSTSTRRRSDQAVWAL